MSLLLYYRVSRKSETCKNIQNSWDNNLFVNYGLPINSLIFYMFVFNYNNNDEDNISLIAMIVIYVN